MGETKMTTAGQSLGDEAAAVAIASSELAGGEVPTRVLVAPWGDIESESGSFRVDDISAELSMEAFAKHGTDVPIDYEHQTLGGRYSSPSGQAPAAGWIKALSARPGVGLFAEIEWTEQATEQLASKQYRYLSPVALVRKSDRRLIGLHSVALTNKPAIRGMKPIVNRASASMDGDADVTARNEAEATMCGDPPATLEVLRTQLSLSCDVDAHTVVAAASARLATLEESRRQDRVERKIERAVQSGRLVGAQLEFARALAMKDESLFDDWLETAPVVLSLGKIGAPPARLAGEPGGGRTAQGIAPAARQEYRGSRLLQSLTSEDAFVADAIRSGVRGEQLN